MCKSEDMGVKTYGLVEFIGIWSRVNIRLFVKHF